MIVDFNKLRERLYTALLSDALDQVGLLQNALSAAIRPLDDALVMCGRARTAIFMEVCEVAPGHNPYSLEIALLDDLKANDVAIVACGGSKRIAPWGGLLSTAATARGAAGAVTDGFVRDIKTIRQLRFPLFHNGIAPLDSRGRGEMQAIDVPVMIDGVRVDPGDLIFGDADGVVVVPARVEAEVLKIAFDKLEREDDSMGELRAGGLLCDVFAKHGVL